jgi:hypothetical protein
MATVTMPVSGFSSAFSADCIQVVRGGAMMAAATRIFRRLLIAEFHFLCFWHCL